MTDHFELTINKSYALKYHRRKQAEELNKLQEKYGDQEDSDSSPSEIEDDTAYGVTSTNDKDFLKTLSLLKKKDPKIYESSSKFYTSEDENDVEVDNQPNKPFYLKDHERKQLLEKGSDDFVSDSECSDNEEGINNKTMSYVEEQEELKRSVRNAIAKVDDDNGEDDFLSLRVKTKEDKEKEKADYLLWIKGQESKLSKQDKQDLDALKRYWNDPELTEDEKFLRDYILNKGYLDKDDHSIPTYSEIVGSTDESEDERAVDEQEDFERKYNFRFEEPDSEFIASYPRTIAGSVRAESSKRKVKRQERESRKDKEQEKRKEELKRLKNLKRQAIVDKLDKIKSVTGNELVGFGEEDINDDFDPNSHDEKMSRIFGDDYYGQDEEEKPVFPSDEEFDDNEDWDNWTGGYEEDKGPHCDDPNFNMDADYEEDIVETYVPGRKRKHMSKFKRTIKKKKPKFDPEEKSLSQYLDEYYKLDYEDLIGDMPCRFKYRNVVTNDFGLTTDEILSCEDKELNKWVSLKKMSQHRTDEEEKRDVRRYKKLSKQSSWKHKILTSLKRPLEEEVHTDSKRVTQQRHVKHKKQGGESSQLTSRNKKLRIRKNPKLHKLSSARLAAYGI